MNKKERMTPPKPMPTTRRLTLQMALRKAGEFHAGSLMRAFFTGGDVLPHEHAYRKCEALREYVSGVTVNA